MAALVAAETVVVILLTVLVVGLLRSHADILKALHDLGAGLEPESADGHGHQSAPVRVEAPERRSDDRGADIAGVTPAGDALAVSVSASHDTIVAFLSAGCTSCRSIWEAVRSPDLRSPGDARVVVVTRGDDLESGSRVAELAEGAHVPVIRSSAAWDDYQVPGAPYFVYVEAGSGRVRGEGTAATWERVVELANRARADEGDRRNGDDLDRAARARSRLAAMSGDRAREARADEELAAAGIHPGDPRLTMAPPDVDRGAPTPEEAAGA